ncbi:hypothetical protein KJ678_03220 [Patescibacteria group bacterium]|nr:hypothetical protein [Patescibacteria group bacterium]
MIDKEKFILLVQTGAISNDIRLKKHIAMDVVNCAMEMPDNLFTKTNHSEFLYAAELLDFEYGLFDKNDEEYPKWIKKYWDWKSKRHTDKN